VLSQGTTLLFVSHDLAAVEATCANGVWLHNGEVQAMGPVREVLTAYRGAVEGEAEARPHVEGLVRASNIAASSPDGGLVKTGGGLDIEMTLESDEEYRSWIYLGVSEGAATPIECSITELIALTRRARLFIGGDTGPMHLAAALRVPVVAIFGPTDPARNGPYGTRSIVLRNPASPTTHTRRLQPDEAMLEISADAVVEAACRLLADAAEGAHG